MEKVRQWMKDIKKRQIVKMAFIRIQLQENEKGECLFKFSNDVGNEVRQTLQEIMETQYLQRREVTDGNVTKMYLKNVHESLRENIRKANVEMFVEQSGGINYN